MQAFSGLRGGLSGCGVLWVSTGSSLSGRCANEKLANDPDRLVKQPKLS